MKKSVYIFLDIDGVLNKESQWKRMFSLDHGCIEEFADYVLEDLGDHPQIILTSTWKHGYRENGTHSEPVQRLVDAFQKYGLRIAGKTESNAEGDRAKEIRDYIRKNHLEMHDIIVIDDDTEIFKSSLPRNARFIRTNSRTGFRRDASSLSRNGFLARLFRMFLGS